MEQIIKFILRILYCDIHLFTLTILLKMYMKIKLGCHGNHKSAYFDIMHIIIFLQFNFRKITKTVLYNATSL